MFYTSARRIQIGSLQLLLLSGLCTLLFANTTIADSKKDGFVGELLFNNNTYSKKVTRTSDTPLEGNFAGNSFGLSAGYLWNNYKFTAEFIMPSVVVVANEQATIDGMFLAGTYWFNMSENQRHKLGIGAFFGNDSYKLDVGPSGREFDDKPTAAGLSYGVRAGYTYYPTSDLYIATTLDRTLNKFDGNPNQAALAKIDIESVLRINIAIGHKF